VRLCLSTCCGKSEHTALGNHLLEANNITVKYGERTAVAGASLGLRPGEMTALIGPNGAGKSTFLQTLNGRIQPSGGSVTLDQRELGSFDRRTIGRRISVVAQEAELRFPVTVLEFVLGGRFAWSTSGALGWETKRDLDVALEVLNETDLTELSGRLMDELSGGERQRARLARALTTEASYLLLDEPTANLDLSHQTTLLGLVRNRCDEGKAAALVVTHDLNLAAQFADNVLLMKEGRTVRTGRPQSVLTAELLQEVFGLRVLVDTHPVTGGPRVTPVHQMHRFH
jgi:ABC-type cobalamin/Fe3+-siderophores transport system ATPase subunit